MAVKGWDAETGRERLTMPTGWLTIPLPVGSRVTRKEPWPIDAMAPIVTSPPNR
jgi:hypothetical protein